MSTWWDRRPRLSTPWRMSRRAALRLEGMAVSEAVPGGPRPRGAYAKTAQRRVEIIEAATAVFAAHGYSGGSLRQVAKDIDISVTSIMHHFSTKELLLEAVLEHADEEAIQEIDLDAGRDGLRSTVVQLAVTGQAHPHLLRLLTVLSAEASDEGHPAHGWIVARYRRVEEAIAGWAMDDPAIVVDASEGHALARRVVAVWDGLQLRWLLRRDFDLVDELGAAIDAMLPQVGRGGGRQSIQ